MVYCTQSDISCNILCERTSLSHEPAVWTCRIVRSESVLNLLYTPVELYTSNMSKPVVYTCRIVQSCDLLQNEGMIGWRRSLPPSKRGSARPFFAPKLIFDIRMTDLAYAALGGWQESRKGVTCIGGNRNTFWLSVRMHGLESAFTTQWGACILSIIYGPYGMFSCIDLMGAALAWPHG